MAPVDLATFRPGSAGDLFDGIVSHVAPVLGREWARSQGEISGHLQRLADAAYDTKQKLLAGEIGPDDAAFLFEMQADNLRNVLRLAEFSVYVTAQAVLDSAFAVVGAAIRNLTGVSLTAPA